MRVLIAFLLTVLCSPAALAEGVRMASTGACYAPDDPYHSGIVPQRSFATMADCVGAGGWDRRAPPAMEMPMGLAAHGWVPMPATPALAATRAEAEATAARWFRPTGGCREARDDLLARMSRTPVTWSADGCRVATGVWVDAQTGIPVTDPERVGIAHVVPPDWAEERGAAAWSPERRAAFYTDPTNLIAHAEAGTAGDTGASAWNPQGLAQACALANAFAVVVNRHGVALSADDSTRIQAAVDTACVSPTPESIALERDARQAVAQAERDAIDAAKGIVRPTSPHVAGMVETPKANRWAQGAATAALPYGGANPVLIPAQALGQDDDRDAGVVAPEKPPIAEPGGRARPAPNPAPTAPEPGTGMGTPMPGNGTPPPEPRAVYDLTDFNGLRIEEIVNMVNGNTVVRGLNDDGQPLDPVLLLQSLGFGPEVINATLQEAFEDGDPERNLAVPTPAVPSGGEGEVPTGDTPSDQGNTVRSPLGGPEVQTDPNLPPFDADPMMLGIGAAGAGIQTAP